MAVLESTNVQELIEHLKVPPRRIRLQPPPGVATEEDALRVEPWCELIDGVLVERAMSYYGSRLAHLLGHYIEKLLDVHDVGIVIGADGMMRLSFGQVRIPDLAFYSWSHFPNRVLPDEAILSVVPDLSVEVLSESNTEEEMDRKRREFFAAGTKLFWIVDPARRTVAVYTSPENPTVLTEADTLDGGAVLPGFALSIHDWFARAGKRG